MKFFQVKKKYWEKGKIKITCGFRRKQTNIFYFEQAYIIFRTYKLIEKIKENQQEFLYYDIELPLIEVLYNMENAVLQLILID